MNKIKDKNSNKVYPKKSLGQNFLKNEEILKQIIEAVDFGEQENVLEIGPGKGALTERLLEKSEKVIAVEKDENLVDFLAEKFQKEIKNNKLILVAGDILEINLKKLFEENGFDNYKLVANIPYYITGKILRLFLDIEQKPESMVLLVQKEVAERICSDAGKASILSNIVQYFGKADFISLVGKENFDPVPKVDSAVIRIVIGKKESDIDYEKKFFKLIKIGFSSPRKTLVNNLSAGFKKDKKEIEKILETAEIDLMSRAQELSLDGWKNLSEKIDN